MRWLTSFKPPQGEEMYLRISEAAVAHALFAAERLPGMDLFGPCERVVVANAPLPGWTQFKRPVDRVIVDYGKPPMINEAQWTALQAVTFNKAMVELYEHMQRFFPAWRADVTPQERLEYVHQLAHEATEKGFGTEQQIWLYANVLGFLGDEALTRHPDIRDLLNTRSDLTPLQRVNRAATLAAERSAQ